MSSPIKGTWKRDPGDPADDGADRLRHSTKDIAENVMIVDLVRNDLGRVCRPGTVRVEQLLERRSRTRACGTWCRPWPGGCARPSAMWS